MQKEKNIKLRLILYFLGLFIMTLGVSMSVKSNLGVSPVSSIPYTITCIFGLEMGKATILFHVFLVLLQILLLRKEFELKNMLQVAIGIVFGYFTTFSNYLFTFLPTPESFMIRLLLMACSTVIIAVGIFFYLPSNIMPLAGEGAMQAISRKTNIEFSKVKIIFDCTMVTISLISCLVYLHALGSVGFGTIFAAVCVGMVLGKLNHSPFAAWRNRILLPSREEPSQQSLAAEGKGIVITISREYGSGGREIGKKLAERMGLAYYDLNLIQKVALESGYSENYVQESEQKVSNKMLLNLYSWYTAASTEQDLPKIEQLYQAEEKVIRELGSKGSCVIVGRLANHILQGFSNTFHVFISADMAAKKKRVMDRDGLSETEAERQILKVEKERANHCAYFTHEQWGNAKHYDMLLKSDLLGIDGTVEMIETLLKKANSSFRYSNRG